MNKDIRALNDRIADLMVERDDYSRQCKRNVATIDAVLEAILEVDRDVHADDITSASKLAADLKEIIIDKEGLD